ncbi:hypothetical protein [Nocardia brasiliensis]|nr:hypothetical protein [Nocardia brasiliensis]
MSDAEKLCSLCGENPVREPGKMMCEQCYTRVHGNWRAWIDQAE